MSDAKKTGPGIREALRDKVRSADEPAPASARRTSLSASAATPVEHTRPNVSNILHHEFHFGAPSVAEMAIYCREFATLLDVGIPLTRSLNILAQRTSHPKLRKASSEVARDVEEGTRLSDALAKRRNIFPALFINVARVGEAGGILAPALVRLAEIMERKMTIRRKIVAAITYPAAAITVALIVLVVILVVAIPKFEAVYADLADTQLPAATRAVIGASHFAGSYWIAILAAVVILAFAIYLIGLTAAGAYSYDFLRVKFYPFGRINVRINTARTARTLGSLLAAGIPLLEALAIVARTSENRLYRNALENARSRVEEGGKLHDALREQSIFPPMAVDMIAIGDEAGALDTMLLKLADVYDNETDTLLDGLTALIEPILIVLLGLAVIFIALAVLLPYFNLATAIRSE